MLQVLVHEKGGQTQRFNFEGDQFCIGREEDNDLVLDRVNISKHHLRLRRYEGQVEVLDLESTNGTYLNGRRVADPRTVRRSDRIYVGDFILMLDGDDASIVPYQRSEVPVEGERGGVRAVAVGLPPPASDAGAPLPVPAADSAVITSAGRVAAPGEESSYLDKVTNRVLRAVLANVQHLDPFKADEITDEDRAEAQRLITGILDEMQNAGELDEGVDSGVLRDRISRELLDLGPLAELMTELEVQEIQVAGAGHIRVLRDDGAAAQVTDRRFSGDRAVILAAQRLARKWGFLVEGAHILEGKVDAGFCMYALLPPTQVGGPVISLRRNRTDANNLEALVGEGVLSGDMRDLLHAAIIGCRRILICASGGTNLDRFMGAIVGEVPDSLRVVCISDTGRLGSHHRGWVRVRRIQDPSDTIGLSDALGVLLRGGVDVFISQRCRHEDAAAVMDAMAGATRGAVVSMWGIDSAHALWRLAGLSTVATGAIQNLTVSLARSVDLLVRLGTGVADEPMQIVEIVEPRVKEGNEIVHMPLFRAMKAADGSTEFKPSGTVPRFLRELTGRGIAVPMRIFKA